LPIVLYRARDQLEVAAPHGGHDQPSLARKAPRLPKVTTELANAWSQTKEFLKGVKHLVALGLAKSRGA
jgi:hypothetical protein